MKIRQAVLVDIDTIRYISERTISEIYPHYYPEGAVKFFLEHHSEAHIINDIKNNRVFLCLNDAQQAIGTVTIKGNEICRLFVLPSCQGKGYGTEMLRFAEQEISARYSTIILDASLPAKKISLRRGYKDVSFHIIPTGNHDFLCYDVMEKQGEKTESFG